MVVLVLLLAVTAFSALCLYRTDRALKERRRMVTESAAQLHQAQRSAARKQHSNKSAKVLNRSRSIHTQAVALYEQALAQQKYHPWASLLGYGPVGEDGLPAHAAPLWHRKKESSEQKGDPAMKTNNMKRAMFEMFGLGSAEPTEILIIEEKKNATEAMAARPTNAPVSAESAVPAASPVVSLRPVSYLAADTVWEGNLRSEGDVEVSGVFHGDINAKGSVILRSTVEGNVRAGSLQLSGCNLTGDTNATELTVVSADSHITGCVAAHDLRCAGAITGDISVSGHITLESSARISGNIITGSISVAKGAVICGGVEIKSGEQT